MAAPTAVELEALLGRIVVRIAARVPYRHRAVRTLRGGKLRIIASIEEAALIGKVLAHLEQRQGASSVPADDTLAHRARGPPGQREFDPD